MKNCFLKLVVPCSLLAACGSPILQAEPLAESQSRFGQITGDVGLLSLGASEWVEPHEGLPIESGDHVRTGEDGTVEIIASEHALWVMQPETDLVAERMDNRGGRLNLSNGVLLGKVDSAHAPAGQNWEFNTPAAICGVRGTEFALDVSREEGTRLGVFEGEVDMQPAEGAVGNAVPVRIRAQQEGFLARGKPLVQLDRFSPRMSAHVARRADLRTRQLRVQRVWSPFTTAVRLESRKKFIAPAPKRPAVRPRPPLQKRRGPGRRPPR